MIRSKATTGDPAGGENGTAAKNGDDAEMADSDDGEDAEEAEVPQAATAAVVAEVAAGGFFENPNEPLRMEDLPDDGHDGDVGGGAWPHALQ